MIKVRKKARKFIFFCCLIVLVLFFYDNFFLLEQHKEIISTKENKPIQLTVKEQQWLKAHQPVRIAFDGYFPPYSFVTEAGGIEGISFDTIKLLSQKLNIQLAIDKRTKWDEIYQAALDKEIDVIATMVNRPDRQFQFIFTRPYVFKSLVIVTHQDNTEIKQRGNLSGKTVALVKGYQYSQKILKEFPTITPFYVENMYAALSAVEAQQVDASISYFAATYFIQNKYLLSHIKVAAFYDRNSANESIAVRKDEPILAEIFQKGLDSLSEAEIQRINSKWYPPIKKPIDYETIQDIVYVFLAVFIVLVLWISQIKYQSRKLRVTKDKLLVTNRELNELKGNLETQVLQRTKQLENSEKKYRGLVENLRGEYFFYKHDLNGIFTYLSPSFTSIAGYGIDEVSSDFKDWLAEFASHTKIDEYKERFLKGEKIPSYEIDVIDNSGCKHCLAIQETPIYDDQGGCIGVEGLAHDITEIKATQERLHWLSYYDELTGLANRRLFQEKFEQLIALSHRNKQSMALLFLDLDHFKKINDNLGHAAGDEVLKETAKRLKAHLRDSDVSARMGGDEFTLILPDTGTKAAENVTKKVFQSLLAPYILKGEEYVLGTSIGIAIYPQDSSKGDILLNLADEAMYEAKKTRSGYIFSKNLQLNKQS